MVRVRAVGSKVSEMASVRRRFAASVGEGGAPVTASGWLLAVGAEVVDRHHMGVIETADGMRLPGEPAALSGQALSARKSFTATCRPSSRSVACHTSPITPCSSGSSSR